MVPAQHLDAELPAPRDHLLEQSRPESAAPVRRVDEQLEKGCSGTVYVEHRHTTLGEPAAACLRRRLVPVEGDHLLDAAYRLARLQLVVTRGLDRMEAREHLVGRDACVHLLDVHGPLVAAAVAGASLVAPVDRLELLEA